VVTTTTSRPLGENPELHTHCVTTLNPNETLKMDKSVHYHSLIHKCKETRNRAFSICLDSSNLGPLTSCYCPRTSSIIPYITHYPLSSAIFWLVKNHHKAKEEIDGWNALKEKKKKASKQKHFITIFHQAHWTTSPQCDVTLHVHRLLYLGLKSIHHWLASLDLCQSSPNSMDERAFIDDSQFVTHFLCHYFR
jgi:hypothetical protein